MKIMITIPELLCNLKGGNGCYGRLAAQVLRLGGWIKTSHCYTARATTRKKVKSGQFGVPHFFCLLSSWHLRVTFTVLRLVDALDKEEMKRFCANLIHLTARLRRRSVCYEKKRIAKILSHSEDHLRSLIRMVFKVLLLPSFTICSRSRFKIISWTSDQLDW